MTTAYMGTKLGESDRRSLFRRERAPLYSSTVDWMENESGTDPKIGQ